MMLDIPKLMRAIEPILKLYMPADPSPLTQIPPSFRRAEVNAIIFELSCVADAVT